MTIVQVEDALIARLKAKGLQVGDIRVQKKPESLLKPAAFVAVEEGKFDRLTSNSFKQTLGIYVYVIFKHLKSDEERRKGIYPVIEGVIGILVLQDLGLKITPLKPTSFNEVTTLEDQESGIIVFRLGFETSYPVEKMNDEVVTDLLRVGLNYYLKPGDNVSDASDLKQL